MESGVEVLDLLISSSSQHGLIEQIFVCFSLLLGSLIGSVEEGWQSSAC